jgi:capsular polysaccharide biosynthesis protein
LRKNLDRSSEKENSYLESLLGQYGFESIDPGILSIPDQISIFQNATEIVGIHGGALTNIVFSNSGTRIFEIFNHVYRNVDYKELSETLELEYDSCDILEIKERLDLWLEDLK